MTTQEKDELKSITRAVLAEDKAFLRGMGLECSRQLDSSNALSPAEPSRAERVDAIIRRDFERYHQVFNVLA